MTDPLYWKDRCEVAEARERELGAEVDALKTRALAAEVALIGIRKYLDDHADIEDRPDGGGGRPNFAMCALVAMDTATPDLAAARELVRKAGEFDAMEADAMAIAHQCGTIIRNAETEHKPAAGPKYVTTVDHWRGLVNENAALAALVVELRGALEACVAAPAKEMPDGSVVAESGTHERLRSMVLTALALPLPEAAKKAAEERALVDAVMSFDDLNESVMGGSVEFGEFDRRLLPLLRAREAAIAALKDARRKG